MSGAWRCFSPDCRPSVPGNTINRLCGSGMDAVIQAARAIRTGEAELMIAGGSESMSRAPFVMPKAETAFSRNAEIYDTTIGWRFVNPLMKKLYGVEFDARDRRERRRGHTESAARTRTPSRSAPSRRRRGRRRAAGWRRKSRR